MILFELRCAHDHHFEAWFKDSATFDAQSAAGEIACPLCGDTGVSKAIMAPRLNKATGQSLDAQGAAHEMRRLLSDLRQKIEASCDYVGDKFADEARKIHYGDVEERPIYGEASAEQAAELEEEGIAVARLPWVQENWGGVPLPAIPGKVFAPPASGADLIRTSAMKHKKSPRRRVGAGALGIAAGSAAGGQLFRVQLDVAADLAGIAQRGGFFAVHGDFQRAGIADHQGQAGAVGHHVAVATA